MANLSVDDLYEILEQIISKDPWEHSHEGLDDSCHYCGSYMYEYSPNQVRFHLSTCVWILAFAKLELEIPQHDGFSHAVLPPGIVN